MGLYPLLCNECHWYSVNMYSMHVFVLDSCGLMIISRLCILSATKTLHWKHTCKQYPPDICLLMLSANVALRAVA